MAQHDNGTTFLDPLLQQITIYEGREYQQESLRREINLCPIDDTEIERLENQHKMLNLIFSDKVDPLFVAPVEGPSRVLDCGHGAGSWALQVAEEDPDCHVRGAPAPINLAADESKVVGIDISLQMNPDDIPDNLQLEVANLNDRFTFPDGHFDLVNSRFVSNGVSFSRWPSYIADIKRVLKREGWVQMLEWDLNVRSDNGRLDSLQWLRRWKVLYSESLTMTASVEGRKDRDAHSKLEVLLRTAGFTSVTSESREIPVSGWSLDPNRRAIGEMNKANLTELLQSLGLYPLTARRGISREEFDQLVGAAVAELEDLGSRPYLTLCIAHGQKP